MFAGLAIALAIIIVIYLIVYSHELSFQGLLLKSASAYLSHHPHNYFLIFLFILLTTAATALIIFQQVSFSLLYNSNNNLFDLTNPGVLGYLNIIELLWAFRFLQDACKYVSLYSLFRGWRKCGLLVLESG